MVAPKALCDPVPRTFLTSPPPPPATPTSLMGLRHPRPGPTYTSAPSSGRFLLPAAAQLTPALPSEGAHLCKGLSACLMESWTPVSPTPEPGSGVLQTARCRLTAPFLCSCICRVSTPQEYEVPEGGHSIRCYSLPCPK